MNQRNLDEGNAIIVEAWNTVLYDKFCRFKHLLVDGLSQHSNAAFERCRYPEGARVLDVGCGFGDSTRRIAKRGRGLRRAARSRRSSGAGARRIHGCMRPSYG